MSQSDDHNEHIRLMERQRQRLVREMMWRPFGYRVMSDSQEADLQAVEHYLLANPPIIGSHDGEPVQMGKGLLPEGEDNEVSELLTCDAAGIQVIPESQWPAYIEGQGGEQQLTIKPYIKGIFNQGSVGSCAAEGGVGALMAQRVASGQPYVTLNPYFVYHTTSGGSDQGSTLSDTVNFLRSRGCASAAVWPRSQGWRAWPTQAAVQDALKYRQLKVVQVKNWAEFGTMLLNAFAVYFGYSGHAIFGAKLISPTRFEYCNSWDISWGDKGFGTLAASSIMWSYGAYVFLSVSEVEG